jgi:UDP-N-acetylmuramate--alanine ligase
MLKKVRRIHFVGIGGVGMSGIAEVLVNLGYRVSGSDLKASETTKRLEALGIRIYIGHDPLQVEGSDVVVRSSAVLPNNVELVAAKQRLIPIIPRAEMLAELMRMKYGIAIAGTHGKTTTTSMISGILAKAGLDPTIVIGGRLNSLGSNARLGRGDFLVAEADESDGSFLKLSPTIAVVTTIDEEHMDFYRDLNHIKETFLQFVNKVPFYGAAVLCLDQVHIQEILPAIEKRFVTYGFHSQADVSARGIRLSGLNSTFEAFFQNRLLGKISLQVPGLHNVLNALAGIAAGRELEIDFPVIREALGEFTGVARRFQVAGVFGHNDVMLVDDYGHHPAEILATLKAAKDAFDRRLVVIFQPHRYTRTKHLLPQFYRAFYQADVLIVTEIYPAGEEAIPGINGSLIVQGVKDRGHKEAYFVKRKEEIPELAMDLIEEGDLVLTLGAGDIWRVGEELAGRLGRGQDLSQS